MVLTRFWTTPQFWSNAEPILISSRLLTELKDRRGHFCSKSSLILFHKIRHFTFRSKSGAGLIRTGLMTVGSFLSVETQQKQMQLRRSNAHESRRIDVTEYTRHK